MNSVLQVHKPYVIFFISIDCCSSQNCSLISHFTTVRCSHFLCGSDTFFYHSTSRIHFHNLRRIQCSSTVAIVPSLRCSIPLSLSYMHTVASPQLSPRAVHLSYTVYQFSHFSSTLPVPFRMVHSRSLWNRMSRYFSSGHGLA